MAIGDALTAPTGVQNQMYGQPSRVPGYSQGLGQAPGQMALPPEPMPIGRPTGVVGGPAYFTPAGYQAPPQPTQAFMPTDVRPDPIGQQFMRQYESPMGQQFIDQYEATQAPMREAEMARRAEEQAAQDARFQEMMDRIAELEGQLATPTPSPVPEPEPYVPGQTPFPGIPDFIRDLDFSNIDFSNIPGLSNFDYDDIMRQYNDRIEMGEPEPIESFLPDPRDLPPMGPMPVMDEPVYTTMPVPDGPRGPGMSIGDMLEGRVTRMPVGEPVEAPVMKKVFAEGPTKRIDNTLPDFLEKYRNSPESIENFTAPVMPRISMPELPDFSNIPTPKPVLRAGDIMPNSPVVDRRPSPRMPAPPAVAPINIPKIPNIPNIDFSNLPKFTSPVVPTPEPTPEPIYIPPPMVPNVPRIPNIDLSNLPKFDLPTTGGRPMIPKFGNINLR